MRKCYASLFVFAVLTALLLSTAVDAQVVKPVRQAISPARRVGVPASPYFVSTGLRVVAKGMKVYWAADTTGSMANTVTTYTWSVASAPAGSVATITGVKDSANFIPDVTGQYIITCTVDGGKFGNDTIFVSTYVGMSTTFPGCMTSGCHEAKNASYAKTNHATIFMRGITGQLEVDSTGRGAYGKTCVRCHTTGWENTVDNGNFGYIAAQTIGSVPRWDSTWWKALPFAGGDYWPIWKDMTLWNDIKTNYPTLLPVATIGCETCHGPGKDHMGNPAKIDVSYQSGVCLQCHDAPKNHSVGLMWRQSAHATMPKSGGESNRTACFPCHNGPSLVAYQANPEGPVSMYANTPFQASISCQSCHDPHDNTNEKQIRIIKADTLRSGYVIPAGIGGMGNLCMTCHRARVKTQTTVDNQKKIYGDRFYPHYSPQADMFLGTNGYEFGQDLSGLSTHTGLENACVTCHMHSRIPEGGSSIKPNHTMMMKDSKGNDYTDACAECHGEAASFEEIRAMSDYDGDGKIEGAIVEIEGMLTTLKGQLPLDSLTGDVVMLKKDSVKVQSWPKYNSGALLGAIWNYWFVKNDFSNGVHNMKYALALLKASFAAIAGPDAVEALDQNTPNLFSLNQNYPNPFNLSTSVSFAISRAAQVNITVYNSAGQLVATLADGTMMPGNYLAKWNATNMTSGVYFYKMTATSNGKTLLSATKKMILSK
jgi:predicted CXXCH cytochrome family protein